MLSFHHRFHGHGSLRYVYKNGRVARGRVATIKASVNPRRQQPRVAVVISKKVTKGAVARNRVRRRLYEVIRRHLTHLSPQGVDVVFIVTSAEVRSVPAVELERIVVELLKEVGLYKTPS